MLNHNVAFRGGATFFRALHLAQGLVKRGHAVSLLASSSSALFVFSIRIVEGVELVLAPGIFPRRLRYGYDFYEAVHRCFWVSQRRFDIVHAFDSRPTVIYPALVAARQGARLVMDWCDWFGKGGAVEQRPNRLVRRLLRPLETYYEEHFRIRADAITVLNPVLGQKARQIGVPEQKVYDLPNGADPERIQPGDIVTSRVNLGLPQDIPIIGYMGSLFAQDAQLLLTAFDQVRQLYPTARLIFIGDPKIALPEDPALIKPGFLPIDQVNQYLAACDVLCLPLSDTSANQGRTPSKLGDYLSAGRPVAACAVGEVSVILKDTASGLAVAPNANELARALLQLLNDPGLRRRMGTSGRRAVEIKYNWKALSQELEQIYQVLLTESDGLAN